MLAGFILGIVIMFIVMSFFNDQRRKKEEDERATKRWNYLENRSIKNTGMTIEERINYPNPEADEIITKERYRAYLEEQLKDLFDRSLDISQSGYYTDQEKDIKKKEIKNKRDIIHNYLYILGDNNIEFPLKNTRHKWDELLEKIRNRRK